MKLTSGVPGFDALLEGGFAAGSTMVLHGPVGRERDAFLVQFVAEALREGAPALVVVSAGAAATHRAALQSAGLDPERAIADHRLTFVEWSPTVPESEDSLGPDDSTSVSSKELADLGTNISNAIQALSNRGARRAVLEILSPALEIADLLRVYALAQSMRTKLERAGFTSLFVLDAKKHDEQTVSTIRRAFSGVLDLRAEPAGPGEPPKITIRYLQGTSVTSDAVALSFGADNRLRVRPSELPRLLRAREELMKSNPGDSTAWATTARILRETGDNEAALWAVETALTNEPESTELWLLKADLLDSLGRTDEAEIARSRASSPPSPPPPRAEISPLDKAATQLLSSSDARLRGNPGDGAALFAKAAATAKLGDIRAALATLDALVAVDRDYPGLWMLKAKLHDVLGEAEKAKESRARVRGAAERAATERGEVVPGGPRARSSAPPKPRATLELRGLTNGVQPAATRLGGPTTGLVNGTTPPRGSHGRVNGLGRGPQGRTNGVAAAFVSMRTGLTNGLTTSTGFTNGLGSPRLARDVRVLRQRLLVIPLVVAVLLFVPLLTPSGPVNTAPITIDGVSTDWVPMFVATSARTPGLDPNVDIVRFGAADNGNGVAFLVEVEGSALRGGDAPPTVDRFDVFVDTDRDAATGYRVEGLGADRLVELSGWRGAVNTSALFEWNGGPDPYDWRGWSPVGWARAAAAARALEVHVDWLALGVDRGPVHATVQARSFDASTDTADYALNPLGAALVVLQEPIPQATLTGSDDALLRLDITAYGAEARLRGLTVSLTGSAASAAVGVVRVINETGFVVDDDTPVGGVAAFQFPERRYPAGSSERLVVVAGSPSATGETLGAILDSPSAVVAPEAVVTVHRLSSVYEVGYIGSAVTVPRVDSGLAEWTSVVSDPAGDVQGGRDADVDLGAFAAEASGGTTFFFVEVEGRLMAGTWVPDRNVLAPPTIQADTDRDGVPNFVDPLPDDFNNDGTPDAQAGGDADGDGVVDYTRGGPDLWLNTTIPSSFPAPYAGRDVRLLIGPIERPFRSRDDVLRVFIDMDNSTGSGYQVGGLGADRMIEVAGSSGQVRSSGLFSFSGTYPGAWSWARLSNVASALTFDYLEFATAATLPNGSLVYVEIGEALGSRDAFGGTSSASLVETLPPAVSAQRASSFDVAPAPLSAPRASSPAPPRVLDIGGNDRFYLRDTAHGSETACTAPNNKVATTAQGSAPVDTITLTPAQSACWYVDATTGLTIPAGDWETLLDVTTSGGGVIVFDTSGTGSGSGTTIDITGPTVGSGPDRVLIVGIAQGNTEVTLTSATWDQGGTNQAMTRIAGVNHASGGSDVRTELWRLVAPTTGSRTLRIVSPSSVGVVVGFMSYFGVNQSTPNDSPATATGTGGTPSVTVSSATGDLVVDALGWKEVAAGAANPGAGQTERYETSASDERIAGSQEAGATSVTMSWSVSGIAEWATIGVSLNPSSWPVEYDVYLDVWDMPTNSVKTAIGSCLNVATTGDDVQCLVSSVSSQALDADDVVRVRVVHSSPAGSVVLSYDDADTTGDSRATLPMFIPEFETAAFPALAVIVVSLLVARKGRKARRRDSPPASPSGALHPEDAPEGSGARSGLP